MGDSSERAERFENLEFLVEVPFFYKISDLLTHQSFLKADSWKSLQNMIFLSHFHLFLNSCLPRRSLRPDTDNFSQYILAFLPIDFNESIFEPRSIGNSQIIQMPAITFLLLWEIGPHLFHDGAERQLKPQHRIWNKRPWHWSRWNFNF